MVDLYPLCPLRLSDLQTRVKQYDLRQTRLTFPIGSECCLFSSYPTNRFIRPWLYPFNSIKVQCDTLWDFKNKTHSCPRDSYTLVKTVKRKSSTANKKADLLCLLLLALALKIGKKCLPHIWWGSHMFFQRGCWRQALYNFSPKRKPRFQSEPV